MERYLEWRDSQKLGDNSDLAEHRAEWAAHLAGQSATDMAADVANMQEAYGALEGTINAATHGQLAGMGEYAPAFTEAAALAMHDLAGELATGLLNQGAGSEQIVPLLEANMPAIAQRAVQMVRDQQAIDDMKAAAKLHFRGAS